MRFSELARKEIINLEDGGRLGSVGDTDLELDESGRILAIHIPPRQGFWRNRSPWKIPWDAVKRVGPEVLIVEINGELSK